MQHVEVLDYPLNQDVEGNKCKVPWVSYAFRDKPLRNNTLRALVQLNLGVSPRRLGLTMLKTMR